MLSPKLWSPGNKKTLWVVFTWHDGDYAPEDMKLYKHPLEAEDDIRERLRHKVTSMLSALKPGELAYWDVMHSILERLDQDLWSAMTDWFVWNEKLGSNDLFFMEEAGYGR